MTTTQCSDLLPITSHTSPQPGNGVISLARGSCKFPLFDASSFTSSTSALADFSSSDSDDSFSPPSHDPSCHNLASSPNTPPTSDHSSTMYSNFLPPFEVSPPNASHFLPPLEVSPQNDVFTSQEEFSPMQRERRTPSHSPLLHVESSPSKYSINVQLPKDIKHEMVTISVLKGDKLKVIADAWHMEKDCKSDNEFPQYVEANCFVRPL